MIAVGTPLTFGLARRLNGDPTRLIDQLADEAAERGRRWLETGTIGDEQ